MRALILPLAALALARCDLNPPDPTDQPAELVLPDEDLTWVDTVLGEAVEAELVIGNDGRRDLTVDLSLTGDEAFVLVTDTLTVPGGEDASVVLEYTAPDYYTHGAVLALDTNDTDEGHVELLITGRAAADQDDDGDDAIAAGGLDCDDADPTRSGWADETCNDRDDDCDGWTDEDAVDAPTWYLDLDGDGFGDPEHAVAECTQPDNAVADATDCDDLDGLVNPGATESCNLRDDDCNEEIDEDAPDAPTWYTDGDGDGHGDPATAVQSCARPAGAVTAGDDCDDTLETVYPGANEVCEDGIDQDCSGADASCG